MHRFSSFLLRIALLSLFLCLLTSEASLAASRFSKVTSLKATYYASTAKLRVSWHKVSGAKKYRVRIYVDGTLLTKATTTSRKQSFEGSLFTAGQTAKIKVQVLPTSKHRASKWKSISYTHGEDGGLSAVSGTLTTENSVGRTGSYYLPEDYNLSSRPMLIAFHGTGSSGSSMVSAFSSLAAKHKFIIVAPDSRKSPSGDYTWEVGTSPGEKTEDYTHALNCMNEVLDISGVSLDTAKVMAVGFSGGGSSAPYLATNDVTFTAFAVLHGGVFIGGLGSNIIPGWFSTGSSDTTRTPTMVEGYANSVSAIGFPEVAYHEFSGGHAILDAEAEDLISWWLD